MPNLTSEQAYDLASYYYEMARIIGEYLIMHSEILSTMKEKETLKENHTLALDNSGKLFTLSTKIVLEDVEATLTAIKTISQKIVENYFHVKDLQTAIHIASTVVILGKAIVEKDIPATTNSITYLEGDWDK